MRRFTLEEAFWSRIDKTETCWLWTGPKMPFGYGHCYVNRIRKYAHRLSYEIHNKTEIDKGMQVNHRCDNPGCVNPDHLYLGTQADNIMDKTIRERHSKLTGEQVVEIRFKYSTGSTSWRILAKEYGVTKTQIGAIIKRKCWKHI